MTTFEWIVLASLVFIGIAVWHVADTIGKLSGHLSNIADRLIDIDATLKNRR